MGREDAGRVRAAYDFFDERRERIGPFDEGDEQNVHAWMRAVTEWIEATEQRLGYVSEQAQRAADDSFGLRPLG